uniref:Sulfotransferase n=1 Tax=Amazona collaria TaxID=241587 RepID=A0A8B9GET6_9PSIT
MLIPSATLLHSTAPLLTEQTNGTEAPRARHAVPCCPVLHGAVSCSALHRVGTALTLVSTGTTWMQEILMLLFSHEDVFPVKIIPNWEWVPWLEQNYFREALQDMATCWLITTHLPAHILASALQQSKAKVIYMDRNPKDVTTSFYHFHRLAKFLPNPGFFDTFPMQFFKGTGKVHYGSWFDHIKGWLGQQQPLDICHLQGAAPGNTAQQLSAFLGCPLGKETLGPLEQHCCFTTMQDTTMANYSLIPTKIMDHSQGCFMRKGEGGIRWRGHGGKQLILAAASLPPCPPIPQASWGTAGSTWH